ncbi:MAG: antibiotic biosynthesis monooxygenase [Burkholderiaceae bacterium]|nr:MAG: antibiotic biosynthesis monooxygenase [Burkholderiaceae bacterium]
MVVIVFRSRVRPGVEAQLETVGGRMYELAAVMPGFVSYKDFAAADGENLSIIEFESLETLAAWRDHPEHKQVQERGRLEFFSEYQIQVCSEVRISEFKAKN